MIVQAEFINNWKSLLQFSWTAFKYSIIRVPKSAQSTVLPISNNLAPTTAENFVIQLCEISTQVIFHGFSIHSVWVS